MLRETTGGPTHPSPRQAGAADGVRPAPGSSASRQLRILGALMLLGAAVSATLPAHPLINQPEGKYVLAGFGVVCLATSAIVHRLGHGPGGPRPVA